MLKINRKWLRVTALALSLPSTILGTAWFCWQLVESEIISRGVAAIILLAVIGNIFFLMIYYAIKQKNKP